MSENESYFSLLEMKMAKAIVMIMETGKIHGDSSLLVVLDDGAGITYGKSQTTENGGGLYKLLFEEYAKVEGVFIDRLLSYKQKLYDGEDSSKKDNLTEDGDFKNLLVRAAKEDPLMDKAQDRHFHKNYFRPALATCDSYSVSFPLMMAFIYDFCIHSGPHGCRHHLKTWSQKIKPPSFYQDDEDVDEDDLEEKEREWSEHIMQMRHNWLRDFRRKSGRMSAYRTASFLDMAKRDLWYIEAPLDLVMKRSEIPELNKADGSPRSDRHYTIKEKDLEDVG